ncbi:hypothetical protein HQ576_06335 [bacterium]|nr:hypothetical protein [bacterium]
MAIVVGVWLALVALEAWHRFDPFIHPPGRRPGGHGSPYLPNVRRTLRGDFGGDLTRMLGFAARARLFGVPRGDIEVATDRRGFRNEPPLAAAHCPVVVTGDSYMDQGLTNADTPAAQLGRQLGVPAYDCSQMAAGPAAGAHWLLASDAFRRRPPKVLVWGFIERNLRASRFEAWPPKAKRLPSLPQAIRAVPGHIKTWLTRWSLLKRWAVALRAEATWRLAGALITDKVIVGRGPAGKPFLFLRGAVRALAHAAQKRQLERVAIAIHSVHAECQRRGIHLAVVLIPDKAHVYARWLPPAARPRIPTPNALDDLAARLRQRGVHAVNLLPAFTARAGDAQPLLYYPDDTHWSEHGIRVAMQAVADSLRRRGVLGTEPAR